MTRILGLDVGDRRVGVAVGDEGAATARPLTTFRRRSPDADAAVVARLAAEQQATELVLGLPLDMDGGEGAQARATRAWGLAIAQRTGLPIAWRDERRSSEDVEARLGGPHRQAATGIPSPSARRRYRARVDREAAAVILQRELDARSAATP